MVYSLQEDKIVFGQIAPSENNSVTLVKLGYF